MMRLILASASPRRRELLKLLGVPFDVAPADIDETPHEQESPQDTVARLAREKARVVRSTLHADPAAVVLAADTTVVLDQRMLEKPDSRATARDMLCRLSGRTHSVWTAVAVATPQELTHRSVRTEVTFRSLSDALIEQYLNTGESYDKAGAYGIQGYGARLVQSIHGTYHNVVGLPIDVTADLLEKAGLELWQPSCL